MMFYYYVSFALVIICSGLAGKSIQEKKYIWAGISIAVVLMSLIKIFVMEFGLEITNNIYVPK